MQISPHFVWSVEAKITFDKKSEILTSQWGQTDAEFVHILLFTQYRFVV